MDFKTVTIEPVKIVGISKRITDPVAASQDMASLWQEYVQENISEKIPDKSREDIVYSIYTDYDEEANYTAIVGIPVKSFENIPDDFTKIMIEAGPYACYTIGGPMPENLIYFWDDVWHNELGFERAFKADFEVHEKERMLSDDPEIDIYISKV